MRWRVLFNLGELELALKFQRESAERYEEARVCADLVHGEVHG
jgi:hypothetical protein